MTQRKNETTYHSINSVKKLRYCRRVIIIIKINSMSKFLGLCDIPILTLVILQRVPLKIIVFSMETPCWFPSEGHQHGSWDQWKHLEFTLALSKHFSSLLSLKTFALTLLNILVIQDSETQGESIFLCI